MALCLLRSFEAEDEMSCSGGNLRRTVPMNRFLKIMQAVLPSFSVEAEQIIASMCRNGDQQELDYHLFLDWLYTGKVNSTGQSPHNQPHIYAPDAKQTLSDGKSSECESFTPQLLVWNIQSTAFAANCLEFLPDVAKLKPADRKTLEQLQEEATRVMVEHESSPLISEFLGTSPLDAAGEVEVAPMSDILNNEKQRAGLQKWLEGNKDILERLDADVSNMDDLVKQWCTDYRFRWKYWKNQTVHSWLLDDGSGGKTNALFMSSRPLLDETCWDLTLGMADSKYRNHPERCKRAPWLEQVPGDKALPKVGKNDFFKLLVFDMIVKKIFDQLGKGSLAALLQSIKPAFGEQRMQKITLHFEGVDIAVLQEVDIKLLPLLEDFWVVKPKQLDHTMNTTILARKAQFEEPERIDVVDRDGNISSRIVGCKVSRRLDAGGKWTATVTGVHLSAKGYEIDHVAKQFDQLLAEPNSILAGDFNKDLRYAQVFDKFTADLPHLAKALEAVKALPNDVGTTSKQRSCFQAQITKIRIHDFAMKDFIFAGTGFKRPEAFGHIRRDEFLPNREQPSDHAHISAVLENYKKPDLNA
eukprot:TRINITY_DN12425_c1_g2_i1.p1 TRINITY_DN12425_c1_g2~~TRINITY_DN12425_c1_g2_i1.p1  ORF type:complete len:584 (+),score=114.67 TRINITY_DN12425_c1_g2_i1:563-2314(+)